MKYDPDQIRRDNPLVEYAQSRGIVLKRSGREWVGLSPFTQERTASFTIYPGKRGAQQFHCFSTGETGDVIDLVRILDGVTFVQACEILAGHREPRRREFDRPPPREAFDPYARFKFIEPPEEIAFRAGERTVPIWNPKRVDGNDVPQVHYTPAAVYPYYWPNGRLMGYVLRIEFPHSEPGRKPRKITPMICWVWDRLTGEMGWSHFPFPEPRPLFNGENIEEACQLLMVEGEKVCTIAHKALQGRAVPLAYAGGKNAFDRTDMSQLKGRSVIISPDAGEGGLAAFLGSYDRRGEQWKPGLAEYLLDLGVSRLTVVMPEDDRPDGWDLADLIEEGADQQAVVRWLTDHKVEWTREKQEEHRQRLRPLAEPVPALIQTSQPETAPDDPSSHKVVNFTKRRPGPQGGEDVVRPPPPPVGDPQKVRDWRAHCIHKPNGEIEPRLDRNFEMALRFSPDFKGVYGYDEFMERYMVVRRPPYEHGSAPWTPRALTDVDATRATGHLNYMGLMPREHQTHKQIEAAAHDNRFNPVKEFMERQVWDGKPRLETWLTVYGGSADNRLNRAIAKKFVLSIVARVMQPGAKVDHMLVIKGPQALKKSTFLKTLATIDGREYYVDNLDKLNGGETTLRLQGCLIAEMPEMTAAKRGDRDALKAWLSATNEAIRPPYGRQKVEVRRKFVLAGTLNPESGYLEDPTGGRRFLNVDVCKVDIEGLKAAVPQLYAEAVAAYRDGEPWWLDEEEDELLSVRNIKNLAEDPWSEGVELFLSGLTQTSTQAVLNHLSVPAKDQTTAAARRVGGILRLQGWQRRYVSTNGFKAWRWFRLGSEEDQDNE